MESTLVNNSGLILIAEKKSSKKININHLQIIYYETLEDEDFLNKLKEQVEQYILHQPNIGFDEAMRLFEKQEYTAAALSAFRYLEESIRESTIVSEKHSNIFSLNLMLQNLWKDNLLQDISLSEIKDFTSLRNKLIHTSVSISQSEATSVLEFAKKVSNQLLFKNKI